MTVTTTSNREEFTANGTDTDFPYNFLILADSDLQVFDDGVLQVLGTEYTVTNVGNPAGGEVKFITAPAAASSIVLLRVVPFTQLTDLVNNTELPSDSIEAMSDKLTLIVQQFNEEINRNLAFSPSSLFDNLTLPDPVANKILQWKSDLSGLENVDLLSSGILIVSSYIETLLDDADADTARKTLDAGSAPVKNLLVNGGMGFIRNEIAAGTTYDSATTPNNDDGNICFERWINSSDGNDIVDLIRSTDTPAAVADSDNPDKAMKLLVATPNKKFGQAQILTNAETMKLRGRRISLSFQAKTTTAKIINNIRASIIEFTGAADLPTIPIVATGTWGVAGTDPTLVASYAYLNTPTNLALTTSYQKFTLENILVGSGANNIGIFIWVDDTDAAVGDELFLTALQLENGSRATAYKELPFSMETDRANFFFWKTSSAASTATAGRVGSLAMKTMATSDAFYTIHFPVEMFKTPSTQLFGISVTPGSIANRTTALDVNAGVVNTGLKSTQIEKLAAGNPLNDQDEWDVQAFFNGDFA